MNFKFPLCAIICCACVMLSCACCLLICNSSILLSADGAVDGAFVHVTLGVHPMINKNGVSFVVTFGHALCANWAKGSASAQLSCCKLQTCHRYCSSH